MLGVCVCVCVQNDMDTEGQSCSSNTARNNETTSSRYNLVSDLNDNEDDDDAANEDEDGEATGNNFDALSDIVVST